MEEVIKEGWVVRAKIDDGWLYFQEHYNWECLDTLENATVFLSEEHANDNKEHARRCIEAKKYNVIEVVKVQQIIRIFL